MREERRGRKGEDEGGEEGCGEVKMCDCINSVYDFIVSYGPLSHNHCHHHIYRITVITYLLMMAARQGFCLGG